MSMSAAHIEKRCGVHIFKAQTQTQSQNNAG